MRCVCICVHVCDIYAHTRTRVSVCKIQLLHYYRSPNVTSYVNLAEVHLVFAVSLDQYYDFIKPS